MSPHHLVVTPQLNAPLEHKFSADSANHLDTQIWWRETASEGKHFIKTVELLFCLKFTQCFRTELHAPSSSECFRILMYCFDILMESW